MPTAPTPSAPFQREMVLSAAMFMVGLVLSTMLHLGLLAPYAAWAVLAFEADTPGEEGPDDAPTGNRGGELAKPFGPVRVAVYTPPPTAASGPAPRVLQEAEDAAPAEDGVNQGIDGGADADVVEAPPLSTADEGAEAGKATHEGVSGKPPRGEKKPCEPIEEIVKIEQGLWQVERSLLDYYATHIRELDKQAGVALHRDEDGKKDGVRIWLPRCSHLRQAGFLNGDVIRTVNGRKVYSLSQAIATYIAVRDERKIEVILNRKGGKERSMKYMLQ